MAVEEIDSAIIVELLGVTLFSVYSEIMFAMWMPAICHFPDWLHLILQFWFIGLPQATIIILPQYIIQIYMVFGVFGLFGGGFSYFRYAYKTRCNYCIHYL